jgi:hypothetical protein
VSPEAHTGRS